MQELVFRRTNQVKGIKEAHFMKGLRVLTVLRLRSLNDEGVTRLTMCDGASGAELS
jgi:hypothetical protein